MPSISRDISFAIEKPSSLNVLIDEINDFKIEHVKEFFVFDFFINSKQNIIKIGFRFIFQSKSITLNIDHVEKELLPLIEKTLIIDGVSIPGMNF
jgi:phenylalanyl-tRNA synthetase beta subunit